MTEDTDRPEIQIGGWTFFEKNGQWYHLSSGETEQWATTAVCRALVECQEERDAARDGQGRMFLQAVVAENEAATLIAQGNELRRAMERLARAVNTAANAMENGEPEEAWAALEPVRMMAYEIVADRFLATPREPK